MAYRDMRQGLHSRLVPGASTKDKWSGQQARLLSLLGDQRDRLLVEGDEGFAAEPSALVSDQAIGEVAAGLEDRQPGIDRRAVGGDVAGVQQGFDGGGDVVQKIRFLEPSTAP